MSEHKTAEFIRTHKGAEIGTAAGIAATVGVIATAKVIRHMRQTEPVPTYTAADVPEVKMRQRRARDDTIRFAQEETYREQLGIFRHNRMHPRSRELLLDVALHTYRATHTEKAGSITFDDLREQLEVRPRVLDKALGRLVRNSVIIYREEDPKEGHVAGFIDSGVLKWAYLYGTEKDIPGFHGLVNDSLQSEIIGMAGDYRE